MVGFNAKIELNGKTLYVDEESGAKLLDDELFNKFIDSAKSFVLNDDGEQPGINYKEYSGLKDELKKFDIGADKELGNEWEFEVNNKSRDTIIKAFKAYKPIGHTKWTLKGDDFSITYIECGDMYDLMDGPSGSKTVDTHFIIKTKGSNLEIINSILKSYKTKTE
ncbi:TPA: hypothetical protein EYQ19_02880 [Candidatus Pacearchaeota archaeon]|nr:hypothetical protein [Candidatus Pacearchaeota archaeon]